MGKKRKIYTKEECIKLYSNCKNRTEFKAKHAGAWMQCLENNWQDEVCPSFYDWERPTLEALYDIVKQYNSKNELRLKNYRIYHFIEKNYDFNQFENLKSKVDELSLVHCVYAYEFKDLNFVYIGRTDNIRIRHWQHKNTPTDSLYKFAKENKIEINNPIILNNKINISKSVELEGYYFNLYKNKGWNMINKAKTGSVGGMIRKWTYNTCKEEAMKYKRYKDFISNSRTAYEKAWKYDWLKEYTWLTKGGDKKEDIRTLDDCIKIAKQYKTYAEFRKNESLIYSYCKYKKWNKQIIWGK